MSNHNGDEMVAMPDATVKPVSYWMSIGFDEEISNVYAWLQSYLNCPMVTEGEEGEYLIYPQYQYIGDDALHEYREMLPHHDMLTANWNRFTKEATRKTGSDALSSLSIQNIEMAKPTLEVMLPQLMQTKITDLLLGKCGLNRDGFLTVSEFLSKNNTMKKLLLNDNQIDDVTVAQVLGEAVKNHPTMEELCVCDCGLGRHLDSLRSIVIGCKNLNLLRLNSNGIDSRGLAHITELLVSNPGLRALRLDRNSLYDLDASSIANAITKNTHLQELCLHGNTFTDVGKAQMMNAVFDTRDLNSIARSNHSCAIAFLDERSVIVDINFQKGLSIPQKVKRKVLFALCGETMSVKDEAVVGRYFDDIAIELLPHVLLLLQKKLTRATLLVVDDVSNGALNRMFCFLKGWNMPAIFEKKVQSTNSRRSNRKRKSCQ